jgi:hypothetical protein
MLDTALAMTQSTVCGYLNGMIENAARQCCLERESIIPSL